MAEQDAEIFQILVCQMGQNADVDPVLDKTIGVLRQTQRRQPLRDRGHDLGPRRIPATLYPEQKHGGLNFRASSEPVGCATYCEKGEMRKRAAPSSSVADKSAGRSPELFEFWMALQEPFKVPQAMTGS
jgi:hypothetical protein